MTTQERVMLSFSGPETQSLRLNTRGLTGGAVVKNPPVNAGATSSSPDPGRYHMPQSN